MTKKFIYSLGLVALFAMTTQSVSAFCIGIFVPEERQYTPPEHTRALVVYDADGDDQTIVLEPLFEGTADDFGMILPVPARPNIDEADEDIFEELENGTNPFIPQPMPTMAFEDAMRGGSTSGGGVTVIEQKEIGDFDATVLQADDAEALTDWLENNDYNYSNNDEKNFEYYEEQGDFYYIALKVTVDTDAIDRNGNIDGRLSPIQIAFETSRPIVPLRTVAGEVSMRMTFTLYTLADMPLYIPGTDIQYSQKLQTAQIRQMPALAEYDGLKRWLVRHEVAFDPKEIKEDLYLSTGNENLVVAPGSQMAQVAPSKRPVMSGVLASDASWIIDLDNPTPTPVPLPNPEPTPFPLPVPCLEINRGLGIGSSGTDVTDLQEFLRDQGHYTFDRITGYYGPVTQRAVQSWQSAQGIVSSGTPGTTGFGSVGPRTRAELKRLSCTMNPVNQNQIEIQKVRSEIETLSVQLAELQVKLQRLLAQ